MIDQNPDEFSPGEMALVIGADGPYAHLVGCICMVVGPLQTIPVIDVEGLPLMCACYETDLPVSPRHPRPKGARFDPTKAKLHAPRGTLRKLPKKRQCDALVGWDTIGWTPKEVLKRQTQTYTEAIQRQSQSQLNKEIAERLSRVPFGNMILPDIGEMEKLIRAYESGMFKPDIFKPFRIETLDKYKIINDKVPWFKLRPEE
jgi:hypothetical protein